MSEWQTKVFWQRVTVERHAAGYGIALDGRTVKTPLKHDLIVPAESLAEKIKQEFEMQEDVIQPHTMFLTRLSNTAIDQVPDIREGMIESLVEYGWTDLLYHRVAEPEELRQRQSTQWDPVLQWIEMQYGIELQIGTGILPVRQNPNAIDTFRQEVQTLNSFALTGLSEVVSSLGSIILGLALIHDYAGTDALWTLSRLDEDWQTAKWGEDKEAKAVVSASRKNYRKACHFTLAALGKMAM